MPLPVDWNTVTVYGTYISVAGTAIQGGKVTFTSETRLRSAAYHTAVIPGSRVVTLDSSGFFSVELPATDDPDIQPSGWAWTVTETFGSYTRTYTMLAPLGSSIDLTNVAPAVPPGGAPVQLVETVAGKTPNAEGDIPISVNDLSDATITTPTAGQLLQFSGSGWINSSLPSTAVVDFLGAVGSQAAMLALAGEKGDWATRTDLGTDWQIIGTDPTVLSSWREMTYPASPVVSVFGRTGAITGTKADVGLANVDNTADTAKPVSTAAQTALDAKAALAHTHTEADVTGLTADLASKAPNSRTLSAGAGLTGGGDLSADRTLAVTYGTTAGTAAVGNDARLSDARTPTAHSHVEADVTGLTADLAGKTPTTRTITAGAGLTGGGDLSADRTLAVTYGTTAGTAAVGNDSRLSDARTPTAHAHVETDVTNLTADLAAKTPTSRTITAGAGLTGGGDLSANRTLAVTYGTTAGTAAVGNDSRLSDARTPTAHSHVEADITGLTADLAAKTPTSRTITAGAGLTGGGDLSADRTLAVTYGTTAGTAAVGNDSRLSDARTPTAHAASHQVGGTDVVVPGVDVQTFTANGTWTKPAWATANSVVWVVCIAGGGGGGSGRRGVSGVLGCGGGGGAGSGLTMATFTAAQLSATEVVAVGAGGAGAAAITVDSTTGNNGTIGGNSTFGPVNGKVRAIGGGGGIGGSATTGLGGSAGWGTSPGGAGGSASAAGAVGGAGAGGAGASGGGGGGGLAVTTPVAVAGGSGQAAMGNAVTVAGTAGTAGGGAGGNATSAADLTVPYGGAGGGGGGSSTTGAGGNGGTGSGYGGGGGGGGASLNGFNSGAGGNGGPGIVQVITRL